MDSRAKIHGHPGIQVLIAYPVAFDTATRGLHQLRHGRSLFWLQRTIARNVPAVMRLLAAIPGFSDSVTGIQNPTPVKRTGRRLHMILTVPRWPFSSRGSWPKSREETTCRPIASATP